MADDYTAKSAQRITKVGMKSLDRAILWIKKERKKCGNKPCRIGEGEFDNVGFKSKK